MHKSLKAVLADDDDLDAHALHRQVRKDQNKKNVERRTRDLDAWWGSRHAWLPPDVYHVRPQLTDRAIISDLWHISSQARAAGVSLDSLWQPPDGLLYAECQKASSERPTLTRAATNSAWKEWKSAHPQRPTRTAAPRSPKTHHLDDHDGNYEPEANDADIAGRRLPQGPDSDTEIELPRAPSINPLPAIRGPSPPRAQTHELDKVLSDSPEHSSDERATSPELVEHGRYDFSRSPAWSPSHLGRIGSSSPSAKSAKRLEADPIAVDLFGPDDNFVDLCPSIAPLDNNSYAESPRANELPWRTDLAEPTRQLHGDTMLAVSRYIFNQRAKGSAEWRQTHHLFDPLWFQPDREGSEDRVLHLPLRVTSGLENRVPQTLFIPMYRAPCHWAFCEIVTGPRIKAFYYDSISSESRVASLRQQLSSHLAQQLSLPVDLESMASLIYTILSLKSSRADLALCEPVVSAAVRWSQLWRTCAGRPPAPHQRPSTAANFRLQPDPPSLPQNAGGACRNSRLQPGRARRDAGSRWA